MGVRLQDMWGRGPIAVDARSTDTSAVARVMVLWQRPPALSAEEVAAWAQGEARRLLDGGEVRSACVRRLRRLADADASRYDWMLELDVPAPDVLRTGRVRELLGDLRMLGMRPLLVVPDGDGDAAVPAG